MSCAPTKAECDMGLMGRIALGDLRPYFFIIIGLAISFAVLRRFPATRVGDGAEYYAMYMAFKETMRPWLTEAAFAEYSRLVGDGRIIGMIPADVLEKMFPALKLGATADFNHFWLYSFLAYAGAKAMGILGLQLSPHAAFIALHWALFCVPVMLAYRFFSWKGVAVVVGLTVGSPLLWFANKVHTEFFTYCLALIAAICVMRAQYVVAAVCMSLASTQNPSFAAIAGLLLIFRVFSKRKSGYGFLELVGVVVTVLTVFLHPTYYFFRYGVPTPQLLAGGAEMGGNLASTYIWLLDPDVGLLPNWPLGVAIAVIGVVAMCRSGWQDSLCSRSALVFFVVAYLGVSLVAQSSTTNLNSGGTVGVSRYALWYVPLFLPLALWVTDWLKGIRWGAGVGAGLAVALISLSVVDNNPSRVESNAIPSRLSMFLQSRIPSLYNPPPEIFVERYSGVGEYGSREANFMAVLGPDCRKVLLLPGSTRSRVAVPPECGLSADILSAILKERQVGIENEIYEKLNDNAVLAARFTPVKGRTYSLKSGADGGFVLRKGWSYQEGWGVWSEGARAELVFPCGWEGMGDVRDYLQLSVVGFTHANRLATDVSIVAGDAPVWSGKLRDVVTDIVFPVSQAACSNGRVFVSLLIANPESPMKAALSSDSRELGVGFVAFKYSDGS